MIGYFLQVSYQHAIFAAESETRNLAGVIESSSTLDIRAYNHLACAYHLPFLQDLSIQVRCIDPVSRQATYSVVSWLSRPYFT